VSEATIPTAFYVPFKRTIWHRLGYGSRRASRFDDLDDSPEWAPGHVVTEVRAYLDWRDRLRLLVSGRLMVEVTMKTDAPVMRSLSSSAIGVMPPRKGH